MNVYDFDNTIYDGESSVDFFMHYIKNDPALIRFVPKVMVAIAKYKAGKITIQDALQDYGKIISDYVKTMENPEKDVKIFWDNHMNKIKPFYKQVQKNNDLIISASPSLIIDEIAKRLGINSCLCTEINMKTGNIDFLCYRENKVKRFNELYGNIEIENFYTDSMNDKPLMDISKNVYFVTKERIDKIK